MSNAIFPTLAGISWDISKAPQFSTIIHKAASGYEYRSALMVYPLYQFGLKYDVLRDNTANNELKTLLGFFNSRKGSFDSFLFTDPSDYTVTAEALGTGNGSNKIFQLVRNYGGFVEPVNTVNSAPLIYVNGVLKTLTTDYTISSTGLVTFVAAPANALAVTWTGTYYYRCRFLSDSISPTQFMQKLYSLSKLDFIGSVVSKV